jgi:hypothetical protein
MIEGKIVRKAGDFPGAGAEGFVLWSARFGKLEKSRWSCV